MHKYLGTKGIDGPKAERLEKKVSILGVTSYGQSTALIPPEASPHKKRLKYVTNISPRRLIHIYYIRWYIIVQSFEEVDT